MKDNFSGHASDYARYRPTYPDALFAFIYEQLSHFGAAWDCGTGNGQVAIRLAERFDQAYATDLSANQLAQAPQRANITYRVQSAEEDWFDGQQFDLVTVAQAIHWFDFEKFYAVVNRVLKPDGLLAVWGYGRHTIDAAVDTAVHRLYKDILEGYWDYERRYVEENYRSIPFPFQDIAVPEITQSLSWSCDELLGYLNTWSAVKHYMKEHNENPVDRIEAELRQAWGSVTQRAIHFPIIIRLGRKQRPH